MLVTAATLVAGVLMSAAVFFGLRAWERNQVDFAFAMAAEGISASIQRSIDRNLDAVRALAALHQAAHSVERDEFRTFAIPLLASNPSLHALGWIPRVPAAEREAFEARAREEIPDFRIVERLEPDRSIPAAERPEYFPVWYVEPLETHRFALGFDIGFSPVRREAAERARDIGALAIGAHVHLPDHGDHTHAPGQFIFSPVYRRGASIETVEARRANLVGMVFGVYLVADTIDASLRQSQHHNLDIYVFESLPDGARELLYYKPAHAESGTAEAPPWQEPDANSQPQIYKTLAVGGRNWHIVLTPAAGSDPYAASWLPWGGMVGGLLFTGLLVIYLGTLMTHNIKTRELVQALKREVAERRRMELEARRHQDFLSTILDTAGALVMVLDPQGRIIGFNRTCETVTGYTFDEVKDKHHWDLFLLPEDVETVKSAFHRMVAEATPWEREHYWMAKDGTRHWIAWSCRVLANPRGTVEYVIVTGLDRTDRRRAEEAEKAAEMAHVMRLSALGELGSGLAHELNQPLGAIVNYAQGSLRRLQAANSAPPGVITAMQEIINEAMRAARIILHLRQLVHKESPEQEPMNINAAVHELVRMFHGETLRQGVIVELQLDDTLPPVLANQVQIEQVLLNLIQNSMEAMATTPLGERRLTLCTRKFNGDAIEVLVCDTGPGIPAAMEDKIFEPFQTTKEKGLGMGLSISWSIIQAHQGQLWATPNTVRGTCFHFTLPISAEPPPRLA